MNPNSSKRYGKEKIAWYAQIPAVLVLFIWFRPLWDKISLLYLVLISIWSPASTADGNEESAKAREALDDTNNK